MESRIESLTEDEKELLRILRDRPDLISEAFRLIAEARQRPGGPAQE